MWDTDCRISRYWVFSVLRDLFWFSNQWHFEKVEICYLIGQKKKSIYLSIFSCQTLSYVEFQARSHLIKSKCLSKLMGQANSKHKSMNFSEFDKPQEISVASSPKLELIRIEKLVIEIFKYLLYYGIRILKNIIFILYI